VNVLSRPAESLKIADMAAIPYPIDFEYKIDNPHGPMDPNGLPLVRHEGRDPYSNPVTISQFALGHHQRWLRTQDGVSRAKVIQCADWLVEHQTIHGVNDSQYGVWFYPYDSPFWGAVAPWISAMAQGEALSVLARAWALQPRPEYVRTATLSTRSFFVNVDDGGVRSFYSPGEPCYEEVAVEPAAHILNGHLFALMGLWDSVRTWGDEQAMEALAVAVPVLTKHLDRYDGRYWSRYSLFSANQLADKFYHGIHIAQLAYGGKEWEQPSWNQMASRWEQYRQSTVKKALYEFFYNAHRGQRLIKKVVNQASGRITAIRK
jgi:heparosan-N-sulfate-glucuronate 5-epimerase